MEQDKTIHVFRHGEAKYTQGLVALADARDLTAVGVAKVKAEAAILLKQIPAGETVAIYASPLGRTLHTAKIIARVLSQAGVNLVDPKPQVAKELREIDHFDFQVLSLLANGGNLRPGCKAYEVRRVDTNPKDYSMEAYYLNSAWKQLPLHVWKRYPPEFKAAIFKFETSRHVTARVLRYLVSRSHDATKRIICVTHQCGVDFLMAHNSSHSSLTLVPGSYLTLSYAPRRQVLRLVDVDHEASATDKNVLTAFSHFCRSAE